MRGSVRKAAAERRVSVAQRPESMCHSAMGEASITAATSDGPPAMPQTTKIPTAMSATSLTTASTAMAVTTPWWRSFTSRLRVPKITVKTARPAATQSAVDGAPPGSSVKTARASVTDWSWSAI